MFPFSKKVNAFKAEDRAGPNHETHEYDTSLNAHKVRASNIYIIYLNIQLHYIQLPVDKCL